MDEILVLGRNKLGDTSPDVTYNSSVINTLLGGDFLLLFPIQWLEVALTPYIWFDFKDGQKIAMTRITIITCYLDHQHQHLKMTAQESLLDFLKCPSLGL